MPIRGGVSHISLAHFAPGDHGPAVYQMLNQLQVLAGADGPLPGVWHRPAVRGVLVGPQEADRLQHEAGRTQQPHPANEGHVRAMRAPSAKEALPLWKGAFLPPMLTLPLATVLRASF